jgi:hypothetical protein
MRYCLALCLLFSIACKAQEKNRFFTSFGFGPAGTFFATGYAERHFPSQYPAIYFNKNFIGRTFFISAGKEMKKNYSLQLRYSNQQFVKKLDIVDTLSGGFLFIYYGRIRHVNHLYELVLDKDIVKKGKFNLNLGLGVYYVLPVQGELEIYRNVVVYEERDFQSSKLEELGGLTEIAFEYKFQPKVNIGIKSQLYVTLTAPDFESVTLVPYVKILFGK